MLSRRLWNYFPDAKVPHLKCCIIHPEYHARSWLRDYVVRLSATQFDSTAPSPGIDSFMQLYPVVLCPIVDPKLQLYSLVDVVRYHLDANPPAVQRIDGHVTMTLVGIAA